MHDYEKLKLRNKVLEASDKKREKELNEMKNALENTSKSSKQNSFLRDIVEDGVDIRRVKELCVAAGFPNCPTDIFLNDYAVVDRDASIISANSDVSSTAYLGKEGNRFVYNMSRFRRSLLFKDECFKSHSWALDLNKAEKLIKEKLFENDDVRLTSYVAEQIVFLNYIRGAMCALKEIGVTVYEIANAQPLMKIFLQGMCSSLLNPDTLVTISTNILTADFREISVFGQTDVEFSKISTDKRVCHLEAKRPFGKLFQTKSAFAEKDQLYIENEVFGQMSDDKFSVGFRVVDDVEE